MPAMTEAEIYERLTKDGESLQAIRKNTEMLRQHFTVEAQRVAHALSQLDPHNQDRHAAEAQRIHQDNNAVLDRVLMQIASTTPQQLPLSVEAINKASVKANVSKDQVRAVLSFPLILFAALPLGAAYAIGSALCIFIAGFVISFVSGLLKIRISLPNTSGLPATFIVWFFIWYAVAAYQGFSKVRSGQSIPQTFFELFFEPILMLLKGDKLP
jgi:hypothetical protein